MKKILSFMSLTLLVAGCADRTMPVADLPEIDGCAPVPICAKVEADVAELAEIDPAQSLPA